MSRFLQRLESGPPVLLDGATGTELIRRGSKLELPLWSAEPLLSDHPSVLNVHREYVLAGAEVITANTFRTNRRTLQKVGLERNFRTLTMLAVDLARQSGAPFVAGSIAPLEDCYRPDLVPPPETARIEHAEMAGVLAEAGCDLILIETMNTISEAVAAVQAAKSATKLPVLVSFVCTAEGRLLSGQDPTDAARAVEGLGVAGVLTNCTPLAAVPGVLEKLRHTTLLPIGAYGNIGVEDAEVGWKLAPHEAPDAYARAAEEWVRLGARVIGGCCGTTPLHIQKLKRLCS